jgi:hypothetical protein
MIDTRDPGERLRDEMRQEHANEKVEPQRRSWERFTPNPTNGTPEPPPAPSNPSETHAHAQSNGEAQREAPSPPSEPEWPAPLKKEAYQGLAGCVVDVIGPHSESDPVALLASFLVGFGSMVGRNAWFEVEATRHHPNEFAVFVGKSSKARKGTSWGRISHQLGLVDEGWSAHHVKTGLVSGEGVIWNVRDAISKRVKGEEVEDDPGVTDKRMLVIEEEFAGVLKVAERKENTLSPVLRDCWDGKNLATMAKNSPATATGPHVSVVGHITAEELKRTLSSNQIANGLGNRHLWFCVRRSKMLPEGGCPDERMVEQLSHSLRNALAASRTAGCLRRDEGARKIWHKEYERLSEGLPGLAGALLGRGEAHVMRLSLIYALLDSSKEIRGDHLRAALALWDYVVASVRHVFGPVIGDPIADKILELLRARKDGVTRNEICNHLGRNVEAGRIELALDALVKMLRARKESRPTGGRPAEVWFAL